MNDQTDKRRAAIAALTRLDKSYYRQCVNDPGGCVCGDISFANIVAVIEWARDALDAAAPVGDAKHIRDLILRDICNTTPSDETQSMLHIEESDLIAILDAHLPATASAQGGEAHEEVLADHQRLVRELDVLWNGEIGAAKQASLCDIVGQIARELPVLRAQPPAPGDVEPVAYVDESDDGLFIEFIYGENGNPLRRGDKLYTQPPQAPNADAIYAECAEICDQTMLHYRHALEMAETADGAEICRDAIRAKMGVG